MRRSDSKLRKEMRNQALRRYRKQRDRNRLAEPGIHQMALVLDHLKPGFNVPKIFRSVEAFGAHEIHMIDIGPFDPAAGKGAFKKVPAIFHDSFNSCFENLHERGYQFFTLDLGEGCQPLGEVALPEKSAFIFGHEEMGISFDRSRYAGVECLTIPQVGETQSLNVSVAASIVMYEYSRQHGSMTAGSR